MKAALWQTENRGNLTPFVAGISFAQKTRVDAISCEFTSDRHKSMNVNDYFCVVMHDAIMLPECGSPVPTLPGLNQKDYRRLIEHTL